MRSIVLLLFYILLTILLIPILLFCYLVKATQPLFSIGKWVLRLGQKAVGIHLDVSGIEMIEKKGTYLFMANHLSFLDGPLLFLLIPQPVRVILKKEIFRIPIIGLGMRHLGFIPVDRKGIRGGKKSIDQATSAIREKGFSFMIFPEGTRSRDGKLMLFKRGGFFLAVNSQAPIIPVTIKGSFEVMPRGRFFVKKGKIKVIFHPPIPVLGFSKDNLPQLMDEVRNTIASGLKERV